MAGLDTHQQPSPVPAESAELPSAATDEEWDRYRWGGECGRFSILKCALHNHVIFGRYICKKKAFINTTSK